MMDVDVGMNPIGIAFSLGEKMLGKETKMAFQISSEIYAIIQVHARMYANPAYVIEYSWTLNMRGVQNGGTLTPKDHCEKTYVQLHSFLSYLN